MSEYLLLFIFLLLDPEQVDIPPEHTGQIALIYINWIYSPVAIALSILKTEDIESLYNIFKKAFLTIKHCSFHSVEVDSPID